MFGSEHTIPILSKRLSEEDEEIINESGVPTHRPVVFRKVVPDISGAVTGMVERQNENQPRAAASEGSSTVYNVRLL